MNVKHKSKDEIEFDISVINTQQNTGEISGNAQRKGENFRFISPDEDCELEMNFKGDNLLIKQIGSCGFGMNVYAGFEYKRN